MINALIMGVFNVIIKLVDVILAPIDLLISQFLPSLSSGISAIGSMFAYAGNMLGFLVSLTGLSQEALSLIVAYFTFKLTVPLMISGIKTAVRWYNALKI